MNRTCHLATVVLGVFVATTVPGQTPLPQEVVFPDLPPAAERQAKSDAEREAGAVILEDVIAISGKIKSFTLKGWTERKRRVRILVLDAKGAERLARHAFFGEGASDVVDIRGRTVTPDGGEYWLDPEKDVRNLDLKDVHGKTRAVARTAFFPHVEPGAVLDLAFTVKENVWPSLETISLQEPFPIRRFELNARGLLLDSSVGKMLFLDGPMQKVYWVPFFLGLIPPRAHATLDSEFNLELEIAELAGAPEEPYAPPGVRTGYVLGLMPRAFPLTKKKRVVDWSKNLMLFGPPEAAPTGMEAAAVESPTEPEAPGEHFRSVSQDLDPTLTLVQLDELGLQPPPEWRDDEELMGFYQRSLRNYHERFNKFLTRTDGAESANEVAAIAPPDLDWRERTKRLFEHARSRVRPDPEADRKKNLFKLLKQGRGGTRDLALYLYHLLDQAEIPSRIALGLRRSRIPLHPILDFWGPYSTQFMVEVHPPGETPLYLSPGNPYATFCTLHDSYLGGLVFLQPETEGDDWTLRQIPVDLPMHETTAVAFSSPVGPGEEEVDLTVTSTLHDTAANYFRWGLGWRGSDDEPDKEQKRKEKSIEKWVDYWANVEFDGELPELDPLKNTAEPFVFEVKMPWKPDIQTVGEQWLVPALPRADLFRNVFQADERETPLWLNGGRYEVSMTWNLPAGVAVGEIPEPTERSGPGGLFYAMEVAAEREPEGKQPPTLTTRIVVNVPYMLPASDYAAVKTFFEELQRTADTRLLVAVGEEG